MLHGNIWKERFFHSTSEVMQHNAASQFLQQKIARQELDSENHEHLKE